MYGSMRQHPGASPATYAVSTAMNSAIASATFFTLREYVISPFLLSTIEGGQYERRRRALEFSKSGLPISDHYSMPSDARGIKLLDTAISGGITGAVLNSWKRESMDVVVHCSYVLNSRLLRTHEWYRSRSNYGCYRLCSSPVLRQ
jgi:hypothetical protein